MKKFLGFAAFLVLIAGAYYLIFESPRQASVPALQPETAADEPEGHVIEDFLVQGFDENGALLWELQGDFAHVEKDTDAFIKENVLLKIQGTTVDTDRVYWQNSKSRLLTTHPVKIIHKRQVIEGIGALGRINEEFLQINQNIGMSLKGPVVITCRGALKIYRGEYHVIFYRDVMIRDTQGTLNTDRLDVFFNKDNNKIRKIIASGNVRIERDGDVSYSEQAVYDAEVQSVKLVGSPRIEVQKMKYEYLDKIRGTK